MAARTITPEDLVALREIGYPDAVSPVARSPLALSPDGKRIAFVITRADIGRNDYCRGVAVLDLDSHSARLVDLGGDYLPMTVSIRGLRLNTGAPDVVTPVWSPDGRTLAYRKRLDGRTEAWVAAADGSGARRVGKFDADVEDVGWSLDGRRIVVTSRPGYAIQAHNIDLEGRSGFLYDDRFQPNDASRPALSEELRWAKQAADVVTGAVTTESTSDIEASSAKPSRGVSETLSVRSPGGRVAWLLSEQHIFAGPTRVHAQDRHGKTVKCESEACRGSIRELFWIGGAVVFLRREGWANSTFSLYSWIPGPMAPKRLFASSDAVHGCVAEQSSLLCMIESAAVPPRVARVDLRSGHAASIFDPNPEFRNIRLGTVRRLPILNDLGLEAWADLVLPPGYRGGRIPMVVVQYNSLGFLRGGTGNEYPVHVLAARGLAVLSIQRPRLVGALDPATTSNEKLTSGMTRNWSERRSLLSVIESGIERAVELGVADARRIGITGLSDGASSAVFALINSRRFAAAAVSSSGIEPNTMMIYGGPRWADFNRSIGFPGLGVADEAFWRPMSLARNVSGLSAPILMQTADHEYLLSLESWAVLKNAGYPVEMYVYPDEYHNKWQPAHRFATYVRNLDWFDFWLADRRSADVAKEAQYRRWDALRQQRDNSAKEVATLPR